MKELILAGIVLLVCLTGCSPVRLTDSSLAAQNTSTSIQTATSTPSPTLIGTPTITPTNTATNYILWTPTATQSQPWESFTTEGGHKEIMNQAFQVLFDQQGDLWTRSGTGFVKWNLENLDQSTVYFYKPQSDSSLTSSMAITSDNAIWITAFRNGLFKFDGQKWEHFGKPVFPTNNIYQITASPEGFLWVVTSFLKGDEDGNSFGHTGQFDDKTWTEFSNVGFYLTSVAPDGILWFIPNLPDYNLSGNGNISSYQDGHWSDVLVYDGDITFSALNVSTDGEVWLSGDGRIFHSEGSIFRQISAPWRDSNLDIVDIAAGPDNSAWFGTAFNAFRLVNRCDKIDPETEDMGVYYYDGANWTHYTTADGLPSNNICDLTIAPDGTVWAGTYDQGIAHFDGAHWTSYKLTIPAE